MQACGTRGWRTPFSMDKFHHIQREREKPVLRGVQDYESRLTTCPLRQTLGWTTRACHPPASLGSRAVKTPLGPRMVAQGQRHTQAETKPLHISLQEARDLALGRGSPPVCTEAHSCGATGPAHAHMVERGLQPPPPEGGCEPEDLSQMGGLLVDACET